MGSKVMLNVRRTGIRETCLKYFLLTVYIFILIDIASILTEKIRFCFHFECFQMSQTF